MRASVCVGSRPMRALVVTNMYPTPERPRARAFVRDQVEALRRRDGRRGRAVRVPARAARLPGARRASCGAATARRRFDVVHAHFGLTAWPALARPARPGGGDAARQRPLPPALEPDHARGAAVHRAARRRRRARSARTSPAPGTRRRVAVLPVRRRPRSASGRSRAREARERLGLDPDGPYLLFPHDPARPLKRLDRAHEAAGDVPLLHDGPRPARRGAATGSTPPTRSSSRPRPRASGWR